jgi:hypothetical protein
VDLFNKYGKLHKDLIIIKSSMWLDNVLECLIITDGKLEKGTRLYEAGTLRRFNLKYKILDRR